MTHSLVAEYLQALSKNQRRFLSRRECGLCAMPLNRPWCGAHYDDALQLCTEQKRIALRIRCLQDYKPIALNTVKAARDRHV